MMRLLWITATLAMLASPAFAAPARRASSKSARTNATAPRATGKSGSRADSSNSGSRTLDEIHIEGEVAVPQVLFITARDQRRFMDFQNHRYLKTSRQLGESTVYPQWIQLNPPSANEARKEPSR